MVAETFAIVALAEFGLGPVALRRARAEYQAGKIGTISGDSLEAFRLGETLAEMSSQEQRRQAVRDAEISEKLRSGFLKAVEIVQPMTL